MGATVEATVSGGPDSSTYVVHLPLEWLRGELHENVEDAKLFIGPAEDGAWVAVIYKPSPVRVFDRALTDREVQRIYRDGGEIAELTYIQMSVADMERFGIEPVLSHTVAGVRDTFRAVLEQMLGLARPTHGGGKSILN